MNKIKQILNESLFSWKVFLGTLIFLAGTMHGSFVFAQEAPAPNRQEDVQRCLAQHEELLDCCDDFEDAAERGECRGNIGKVLACCLKSGDIETCSALIPRGCEITQQ